MSLDIWFHMWYRILKVVMLLTKLDKLYAKMTNNPKDVKFENLDKILRQYGSNAGNQAAVQATIRTITPN